MHINLLAYIMMRLHDLESIMLSISLPIWVNEGYLAPISLFSHLLISSIIASCLILAYLVFQLEGEEAQSLGVSVIRVMSCLMCGSPTAKVGY